MTSTGLFNHVGTVHRAMGHANADETKSNGDDHVMFELSRDYEKAWQLIHQGDRLACWIEHLHGKDIASAYRFNEVTIVCARGTIYIYLFADYDTLENFLQRCTKLNVEFYLPLPDDMIVISREKLEAIATKVIQEKVGKP